MNQPHRQVRFHALATIATLIALGCAAPASAAVFGQYDFNSFGDAISNPSTPNVVSFPGVFVSSLDRDAGGDGNGDGLGTITATATRDSTPDVFTSTALAIGVGTTARNPFHATTPTQIVAAQDYLTFTLISTIDAVRLTSFSFDYGASVSTGDTTGLLSAAQLFYSLNAAPFVPVGERQDRTVPSGSGGFFTGFITSVIDLASIPTLSATDSIEFRLAFGDNSGVGTTSKGVYLDNLVLSGIVPEPALLGLPAVFALGRGRRRRRM